MCSAGCTRTEAPIKTNSSVETGNTGASGVSTLEPSAPEGAPEAVASVGSCNIDVLNDQAPTVTPRLLPPKGQLRLEGWAVDESNPGNPPGQLFIVLQEVVSGSLWHARVSARVPRPDVTKAMGSSLMSGFRTGFDISNLPSGEYRVLVAFWQDSPLKMCDAGRRVRVE